MDQAHADTVSDDTSSFAVEPAALLDVFDTAVGPPRRNGVHVEVDMPEERSQSPTVTVDDYMTLG